MAYDRHFLFGLKSRDYQPDVADSIRLGQNATFEFRQKYTAFEMSGRSEFRPRQTRQLPRAVDLKGRLLSCQSY